MLPRPILVALLLMFASLLSACSVKNAHFVNSSRDAPTQIRKGDRIVVILESYSDCGNPVCAESNASASAEASFTRCLDTAISARIPAINVLRTRDFREKVFPGVDFKDAPRSEKDILAALDNASIRNEMATLGLKYILVLRVDTSDSESKWGGGGAAIGKEWERRTSMKAVVLDVNEGKRVGSVDVSNAQHKAAGVGFIMIIPVPIYIPSTVESESCRHLGLALADFLQGKD